MLFCLVDGSSKSGVGKKTAILYSQVNPRELLVNYAPCTYVQMSNFRSTHLLMWQANGQLRSFNQRVRIVAPKSVPIRFVSMGNGIVIRIFTVAKAVQDEQEYRGNRGVFFQVAVDDGGIKNRVLYKARN